MAAGLVIGVLSRAVDTAAWAPPWIGSVLTPWLAAACLAGALAPAPGRGMAAGLAMLGGIVGAYLLAAGTDAAALWPRLALLAVVAGPLLGWAGATWRELGSSAGPGLLLLGGVMVLEVLVLEMVGR